LRVTTPNFAINFLAQNVPLLKPSAKRKRNRFLTWVDDNKRWTHKELAESP
jgi:hypothetical protein